MAKVREGKLSDFRPQAVNLNKHTQRGMRELARSLEEDGYVAPITVAADGEAIDGSARMETVAEMFGDNVLVVEHDGTRPLVMVRKDIPTADTDAARRIALRANRIAQLNLEWDIDELEEVLKDFPVLGSLFSEDEIVELEEGAAAAVEEEELLEGTDLTDFSSELGGAMALKPFMDFERGGMYDLPPLRDDMLADLPKELYTWPGDDLRDMAGPGPYLLVWSVSSRMIDFDRTILAFYTGDLRFESAFTDPSGFTTRLLNAGVQVAIAPNYSSGMDWPQALRIFNQYKSRWVARYFQEAGIRIIPDLIWGGVPGDIDMACDGIPVGLPAVSMEVQTARVEQKKGGLKREEWWEQRKEGLEVVLERLKPQGILFYASKIGREWVSELDLGIPVTVVPTRMDVRRDYLAMKAGKLAKKGVVDNGRR